MNTKNNIPRLDNGAPSTDRSQTVYSTDRNIKNLNTHIIRVKNDLVDVTYKENPTRPVIIYDHVPDAKAPGAYILKTVRIDGLPMPKGDVIYIVNRDTVSATRKIEREMRTNSNFDDAFAIVDANPGNWISKIKETFEKEKSKEMCKYVERYDLRAPGEQVRDRWNKISHCRDLISEFD